MSGVITNLELNGEDVTVRTYQDAQVNADWASYCRGVPQHGKDLRHKWHLPNNIINAFYLEYAGDGAPPPMNQEFWVWVDRKMADPQYSKFRTDDPSNPFFSGYKSKT